MNRAAIWAGVTALAGVAVIFSLRGHGTPDNFTTKIVLNSTGAEGFMLKRTIPSLNLDPIMAARESLMGQQALCKEPKPQVLSLNITETSPNLVYEAKIRCF